MKKLVPLALLVLLCAAAPIDPTADPTGFLAQLATAAHTAWPLAIGLGLFAILEVTLKIGPKTPLKAWLDVGRRTLVISGAVSVLGAVLDAALNGASAYPALLAGVMALAAYWHPALPVQPKVVA